MTKLTTAALFFLAAGIFTSVTILSAYQILFAIPLAYYTWLAIKNKEFELPKSAWWLLGFTAVALLSLVINFDVIPKPSKNFGRLKYFIFGACGIFVMRVWLKEASDKTKMILFNTLVISMVAAACVVLYKRFILGEIRPRGLTETMRYGYGSAMITVTLLSAYLHRKNLGKWYNPTLGIIAIVSALIGIYVTETRGAVLGLICGLPFVILYFNKKAGIIISLIAVLTVGTLGGFYFFGNAGQDAPRLLQSKDNGSDQIRRSQWMAAIYATKERPILGWGLSNFHSQLKRIKHQYDLPAKEYDDAHSHNLFLEVASGTGIVGLILFLGWFFSWAWETFKAGGLTAALIIPFGAVLFVSSQFEVTLDANNAVMIFALYAMSLGNKNVKQS